MKTFAPLYHDQIYQQDDVHLQGVVSTSHYNTYRVPVIQTANSRGALREATIIDEGHARLSLSSCLTQVITKKKMKKMVHKSMTRTLMLL